MSNMQERLEATVVQAEIDVNKFHQIVHGDAETTVETENGTLSSLSKQMKDVRDEITGGVSDVVSETENARDETIRVKDEALETEVRINENKKAVEELKSETSDIKNQAQEIYNQIESATLSSLDDIDKETAEQISNINEVTLTNLENIDVESSKQIELAKEQANLAIQAAQTTLYSVIDLAEVSGDITLLSNHIYNATIIGNLKFILPTSVDVSVSNQIKLEITIGSVIPEIDWSTSIFYQEVMPEISSGNYVIYFDYVNSLHTWICGAVKIGANE